MDHLKHGFIGVVLALGLLSSGARADDPPKLGVLGVPLGKIVVIEGADDPNAGIKNPSPFRVTAVDGKKLANPAYLRVVPKNGEPIGLYLKGYESVYRMPEQKVGAPVQAMGAGDYPIFAVTENLAEKSAIVPEPQAEAQKKWEYAELTIFRASGFGDSESRFSFRSGKTNVDSGSWLDFVKKLEVKEPEKCGQLDVLNHLGSQGWEMSGTMLIPRENRSPQYLWYFKRERK